MCTSEMIGIGILYEWNSLMNSHEIDHLMVIQ